MKKEIANFLFSTLVVALVVGHSVRAQAACISPQETGVDFRKEEAIRIVEELSSRITNALDNAFFTIGTGLDYDINFGYILDLQLDRNNLDITIDSNHVTDAQAFETLTSDTAYFFKYQKRLNSNNILVSYSDKNCVRELTIHAVGSSFGMTNEILAPRLAVNFVDFDRRVITWVEKCPGQFRVKSLLQITESSFSLPNAAEIISPPIQHSANPHDNDAPGAYLPPPVKRCRESGV